MIGWENSGIQWNPVNQDLIRGNLLHSLKNTVGHSDLVPLCFDKRKKMSFLHFLFLPNCTLL